MNNGKDYKRMEIEEIRELMILRKWSKTQLAAALDLAENAVYRWLDGSRNPQGPACILMKQWLTEARAQAQPKNGRKKSLAGSV